jgi:hypothetical protein
MSTITPIVHRTLVGAAIGAGLFGLVASVGKSMLILSFAEGRMGLVTLLTGAAFGTVVALVALAVQRFFSEKKEPIAATPPAAPQPVQPTTPQTDNKYYAVKGKNFTSEEQFKKCITVFETYLEVTFAILELENGKIPDPGLDKFVCYIDIRTPPISNDLPFSKPPRAKPLQLLVDPNSAGRGDFLFGSPEKPRTFHVCCDLSLQTPSIKNAPFTHVDGNAINLKDFLGLKTTS